MSIKSPYIFVEMKTDSIPGDRGWIRATRLAERSSYRKGGHSKMLVHVQDIDKPLLIATSPVKARMLLKACQARVVHTTPFTIRLT